MLKGTEVSKWLQSGIDAALEAGNIIKTAMKNTKHVDLKHQNPADLVTETDKRVESFLFDRFKKLYPDHLFIGEESAQAIGDLVEKPTWIIDPVDGTMNFVHNFPFFCVSIGLTYGPEAIIDQLFYASKGNGAYMVSNPQAVSIGQGIKLNGAPTPVPAKLSDSLLLTEFGSSKAEHHLGPKVQLMGTLIKNPVNARGFRCLGAAAMAMCSVAQGVGDLYFEAGIHVWDICAGIVIVTESGGVVRNWFENDEFDMLARNIIVVRGGIENSGQQLLIAEFNKYATKIPYERD